MITKKNSFEDQLKTLEAIVTKLENGDVPLAEALDEFQAGVKISQLLEKQLTDAEATVAKLMDKDDHVEDLDLKDETDNDKQ